MVNWSELPDELVTKIACNVVAVEDFVAFIATCKSWRTVVTRNECNPRVPTLFFADPNHHFKCLNHQNQRLSRASSDESCAWGSACGWIFMNNRLVNPITNAVISLPENTTITRSARFIDWNVKRVLVFKRPSSWRSDGDINDVIVVFIYNWFRRRYISRRTRNMTRNMPGNIQFIYHGRQFSNPILTTGNTIAAGGVADVVCFQDRVYGVDKNANLLLLTRENYTHGCTFEFNSIVRQPNAVNVLGKRIEGVYLVESAGELLMIVKMGSLPFFKVYKFCFRKRRWLSIDSLGSNAVFIGTNYTMSVSATEYDEDGYIRGNCIYFTRHVHSATSQEEKGRSYLYIYDMKSKMISQHRRDGKKIECSGCCWLLPSLN